MAPIPTNTMFLVSKINHNEPVFTHVLLSYTTITSRAFINPDLVYQHWSAELIQHKDESDQRELRLINGPGTLCVVATGIQLTHRRKKRSHFLHTTTATIKLRTGAWSCYLDPSLTILPLSPLTTLSQLIRTFVVTHVICSENVVRLSRKVVVFPLPHRFFNLP